jgi:hypothetical protein
MWNYSSMIIIDERFFDHILFYRHIIWGYIGMILSIFGIVGNIITIVVLLSPSMRATSTNVYLTALSCSNILYLLIFIPYISLRYILYYRSYIRKQSSSTLEYLLRNLPILTPISDTILLSIIYLTIAISIDRFISIKSSLKIQQIFSLRTILFVILSIYIISILYCIPFWLEQQYDPETEQCHLTKFGKKIHLYIRVYIYIPIFSLIPFLTLTYINIILIKNIIEKKRRKRSLGVKSNRKNQVDYQITLMLVIIIIVSVLCYVPLTALHAWYAYDARGSYRNLVFHFFYIVAEFMLVLNASTNVLLYCFFGKKFRQIFIEQVSHLMTNHHQQMNTRILLFRLSLKRRSEERQRTLVSRDSSIFIHDTKKPIDSNNTFNQQESFPLVTKLEPLTTINENVDSYT